MSRKKVFGRIGTVIAAVAIAGGLTVGGCGGDDNPGNSSGGGGNTATLSGDILTTNKDGQKYRTVVIGGKRWMAENLNMVTDSSWCYDNDDSNCAKYGRLYNWDAAMKACPSGWRLPDSTAWINLFKAVGGEHSGGTYDGYWNVGGKLRSTDWDDGTDDFGWTALPGGGGYSYGTCILIDKSGHWWSATRYNNNVNPYYFQMTSSIVIHASNTSSFRFSVRCVQ